MRPACRGVSATTLGNLTNVKPVASGRTNTCHSNRSLLSNERNSTEPPTAPAGNVKLVGKPLAETSSFAAGSVNVGNSGMVKSGVDWPDIAINDACEDVTSAVVFVPLSSASHWLLSKSPASAGNVKLRLPGVMVSYEPPRSRATSTKLPSSLIRPKARSSVLRSTSGSMTAGAVAPSNENSVSATRSNGTSTSVNEPSIA